MTYHGIAVPIFSLRSRSSLGIGGYLDLIPLIDLCCQIGFNLIQILPIYDTQNDPSPYAASSGFAFHPIYLSIPTHQLLKSEKLLFEALEAKNRVEYSSVLKLKQKILKRIYLNLFDSIEEELIEWLSKFPHLKPYSVYCASQRGLVYSADLLESYFEKNRKECLFFVYLQKQIHEELAVVKKYADDRKIQLMCDLPILVTTTSQEVWQYPQFFHLDQAAGTPPDSFNPLGQYWGFPTYHWKNVIDSDYLLWKEKFKILDPFFHFFRIDHILGFFRLYTIPIGKTPKEGHYLPHSPDAALKAGKHHLSALLKLTSMRAIGEDLGNKLEGVDEILKKLGIATTKIVYWEKTEKGLTPLHEYPFHSIVSLSNHDTPLFFSYCHHHPKEAIQLFNLFGIEATQSLATIRYQVLKQFHKIPVEFKVNLIQEYLALNSAYVSNHPEEDRINIPGEIHPKNWTYRMIPSIETLLTDQKWIDQLKW